MEHHQSKLITSFEMKNYKDIPVEPLRVKTDVAVLEKVNTDDDRATSIHLIICCTPVCVFWKLEL